MSNAVPTGFTWRKLGELCERIDYGFTASADFSLTEPRFLRITDIQNGEVHWDKVPGCKISKEETEANQLRDGDIVFARTGATTGKSFLIRNPPPSVFASYLIRLRLKPGIRPEFLSLFFNSELYWEQIRAQARGGIQPNFNATMLVGLRVLCADDAEQENITRRLRGQLAEVERARAAVAAQLHAAEALPAAFLRAVFSTPTAQEWPRQPLVECSDLLPSKSIALDSDTEVQTITSACLTEWGFQTRGVKSARMWAGDAKKALAQAGEILVARSNTPELVGRAALFPGAPIPLVASDLTIRLWPRASISGEFLSAFLSSLFVAGYWRDRAGGASGTMKKITRNQIENLPVPCPSLSEQQRIAARMKADFEQAQSLREHLSQKLAAVEKLPATLLREAFSGRV